MCKRYKCIREYPFGPPIGTITRYDDTERDLRIAESYPEFWELVKGRVMFKTTDNKTVFVGDKVIYVDDCFELFIDSVVNDSVKIYDYCFLDIESAKEFVNLNKPRYSLKDILDSTVAKYNTGNILIDITKLKLKK